MDNETEENTEIVSGMYESFIYEEHISSQWGEINKQCFEIGYSSEKLG